jgi:transposase InsO family protein
LVTHEAATAGCHAGGLRASTASSTEALVPAVRRSSSRATSRRGAPSCAHGVRVVRLLTDNGAAYRSRVVGRTRRWLGLGHSRTRPYRPQTNGKAERWIRTVLGECLYVEVFHSADERRLALRRFIGYYNG